MRVCSDAAYFLDTYCKNVPRNFRNGTVIVWHILRTQNASNLFRNRDLRRKFFVAFFLTSVKRQQYNLPFYACYKYPSGMFRRQILMRNWTQIPCPIHLGYLRCSSHSESTVCVFSATDLKSLLLKCHFFVLVRQPRCALARFEMGLILWQKPRLKSAQKGRDFRSGFCTFFFHTEIFSVKRQV